MALGINLTVGIYDNALQDVTHQTFLPLINFVHVTISVTSSFIYYLIVIIITTMSSQGLL